MRHQYKYLLLISTAVSIAVSFSLAAAEKNNNNNLVDNKKYFVAWDLIDIADSVDSHLSSCNSTSHGDGSPCPDGVSMVWAEGTMVSSGRVTPGAIARGGLELKLSLCCGYQFQKFLDIPRMSDVAGAAIVDPTVHLSDEERDKISQFLASLFDRGHSAIKAAVPTMFPVQKRQQEDRVVPLHMSLSNDRRALHLIANAVPQFDADGSVTRQLLAAMAQRRALASGIIAGAGAGIGYSSSTTSSDKMIGNNINDNLNHNNIVAAAEDVDDVVPVSFAVDRVALDCNCPRSFRAPQTVRLVPDEFPGPLTLRGGGDLCQNDDNDDLNNNNKDPPREPQFRISIAECAQLPTWVQTEWTILAATAVAAPADATAKGINRKELVPVFQDLETDACAIIGISGFEFDVTYTVSVNVSVAPGIDAVLQTVFTRRRKPVPISFLLDTTQNMLDAVAAGRPALHVLYGRSALLSLGSPFRNPSSYSIACYGSDKSKRQASDNYNINNNQASNSRRVKQQQQQQNNGRPLSLCFLNESTARITGLEPDMTLVHCEVSDVAKACGRGAVTETLVSVVQSAVIPELGDTGLDAIFVPACASPWFPINKESGPMLRDGSSIRRRLCGSRTVVSGTILGGEESLRKRHELRWDCGGAEADSSNSGGVTVEKNGGVLRATLHQTTSALRCRLELYETVISALGEKQIIVKDVVQLQVLRVQQKFTMPPHGFLEITTKTRSLTLRSPVEGALGYFQIDPPLSIVSATGAEMIKGEDTASPAVVNVGGDNLQEGGGSDSEMNAVLMMMDTYASVLRVDKPTASAVVGNLPLAFPTARDESLTASFFEESVFPCAELAWNQTISVVVAPPEISVQPLLIWTDEPTASLFGPERVAPDEKGFFRVESSKTIEDAYRGNDAAQRSFAPCTVDGEAELAVTGAQTAQVSRLGEGKCIRLVRSIGNSAGTVAAPYVVRRCTTIGSEVCAMQQRVFSSMSNVVHIAAPPLPPHRAGELDGRWSCERGDVHVPDPVREPHVAVVRHLPRGATSCTWTVQGRGEQGRPRHMCSPCVMQLRVVAAASDCPHPLQLACSPETHVQLFDASLVDEATAAGLSYKMVCDGASTSVRSNVNIASGSMHVTGLPVGAVNCTLFVSEQNNNRNDAATSTSNSNTRQCPLLFERRLPPQVPDFSVFLRSAQDPDNKNSGGIFVAITNQSTRIAVHVTMPDAQRYPAVAQWSLVPSNHKLGNPTYNATSETFRSISVSSDDDSGETVAEFETTFTPRHRGFYKLRVVIRDPIAVCGDVEREIEAIIVDAGLPDEVHYSCGATALLTALPIPQQALPYINTKWQLSNVQKHSNINSNNNNCSGSNILMDALPQTFVSGLGYGQCNFDWIVSLRHNASAMHRSTLTVDTVSENLPTNGTSFLVPGESTSMWATPFSSEWQLLPPPSVSLYRSYVRTSRTGRSILISGLELPNLPPSSSSAGSSSSTSSDDDDNEEQPLLNYLVSYRPRPLWTPPRPVDCPMHRFTVARVHVSVAGRLVGLRSECDLVRTEGGLVVLDMTDGTALSGTSRRVRFEPDFRLLERELRAANNCSNMRLWSLSQQHRMAALSHFDRTGAEGRRLVGEKCVPRWWATNEAEWSDFSLDKTHRVLRFRLRMKSFVALQDLVEVFSAEEASSSSTSNNNNNAGGGKRRDFFEGARIPLSVLRGLTGTPDDTVMLGNSGYSVAPVTPVIARIGVRREYDNVPAPGQIHDGLDAHQLSLVAEKGIRALLTQDETAQRAETVIIIGDQTKNKDARGIMTSSNNNNNQPLPSLTGSVTDIHIQSLGIHLPSERNLVLASEYDLAVGGVQFNASFAPDTLTPVEYKPSRSANSNNNNNNNYYAAPAPAWTNFSSCPVIAFSDSSSVVSNNNNNAQHDAVILRGQCSLLDQPQRSDGADSADAPASHLLVTQLGPKYEFTADKDAHNTSAAIALRISKRSLCGLCDRRLSMDHFHSAVRMEQLHKAQQQNWTRFMEDHALKMRQLRGDDDNFDASKKMNAAASMGSGNDSGNIDEPLLEDPSGEAAPATSTVREQHQQQQQQQQREEVGQQQQQQLRSEEERCSSAAVDFTRNDWITLGAIRVEKEPALLLSTLPVAQQCAVAHGLGSFVVQARHGYFLPTSSEIELDIHASELPPAGSAVSALENAPPVIDIDSDAAKKSGAAATMDADAFKMLREQLKPTAFVKNGRQLVVKVNAVPRLQLQRGWKLVLRLSAKERYFNGKEKVDAIFLLTIIRSSARLEMFHTNAAGDSSHLWPTIGAKMEFMCENTLKQFGAIARITLEGNNWHPRVGDGSASGHNIAMINGFYDSAHANQFPGADVPFSPSEKQPNTGSLQSPFVTYLTTVLKPQDVRRVSNDTVDIVIRPCENTHCGTVSPFSNFHASELISFAVPDVATSCPGCLIARPPFNVLGLAASVQPSLSAEPLTGPPSGFSNARNFDGIIPKEKGAAAATQQILPREIYLHAVCSTWSHVPAYTANDNLIAAAMSSCRPSNDPGINSFVQAVRVVSPTVLAFRIAPKDLAHPQHNINDPQKQQQQQQQKIADPVALYRRAVMSVPVPLDWLLPSEPSKNNKELSARMMMSRADAWTVAVEIGDPTNARRGAGATGNPPGLRGLLQYRVVFTLYSIFNAYMWFIAASLLFDPSAASFLLGNAARITPNGVVMRFVQAPPALAAFAATWVIAVGSGPGMLIAAVPWVVAAFMLHRANEARARMNRGGYNRAGAAGGNTGFFNSHYGLVVMQLVVLHFCAWYYLAAWEA